jgi:hypothetical protein
MLLRALRCAALAVPLACAGGASSPAPGPGAGATSADDLLIVDCLLPGQVRRLGTQATYVTPRRPMKTTARDCALRGGEYVAYDRASRDGALAVWLPAAEQGDAEAQTYVGEIYERGLGAAPDPASAAAWYRRAAEQGFARAQMNLGSLYERGAGVTRDPVQAIEWYRSASGIEGASFGIAAEDGDDAEAERLRGEVESLRGRLEEKERELQRSQEELRTLRERLGESRSQADAERAELARLRQELAEAQARAAAPAPAAPPGPSLEAVVALQAQIQEREKRLADRDREIEGLRAELARMEAEAQGDTQEIAALSRGSAGTAVRSGIGAPLPAETVKWGRYHALVIGNDAYRFMPPLRTATHDARVLARVLEEEYGFEVRLLLNATRYDLLSALNELRQRLTFEDNLLVYYAGHGILDEVNQRGNWLPVDAEPGSTANWVSNVDVTDVLNAMAVRQLLVVADSCYAGTLTRSAVVRLEGGKTPAERLRLIRTLTEQRSRMVLTSGGLEPVLDTLGGEHSLFAQAFLDALAGNAGMLTGQELFQYLLPKVTTAAGRVDFRQVPEYAPIKFAGHESGDFFFVRRPG